MKNIFVIVIVALFSLSAVSGGDVASYLSSLLSGQPTSVQRAVVSELRSVISIDTKATSFPATSISSLVSSILNNVTDTLTTTTETTETTTTETITQSAAAFGGQNNGAVIMTILGLVASFVLFMAL